MAKKRVYENKWTFEGNEVDEPVADMLGFVYKITNITTGRFYIGRKNVVSKSTKPPLAGEKKKRITFKESDWKHYWSSSKELQADIETLGVDNFKREILVWCANISVLQYLEQYHIFTNNCMVSSLAYNSWFDVKLRKCAALIEYGKQHNL